MTVGDRAVHVVVSGNVQGVFFRAACRRRAEQLGVRGWVSNRDDGTVEAVFAGRAAAVDAMVAWTRTGPPQARVTGVQVEPTQDPSGDDFRVV